MRMRVTVQNEPARARVLACHVETSLLSSIHPKLRGTQIMEKAKESAAGTAVSTGLRGVVAASSSIGDVNGEKGELIYQGVNIHDLATKSTFEEVVFLLWNGRLPKRTELDDLRTHIAAAYELPWQAIELIKGMYARVPATAE